MVESERLRVAFRNPGGELMSREVDGGREAAVTAMQMIAEGGELLAGDVIEVTHMAEAADAGDGMWVYGRQDVPSELNGFPVIGHERHARCVTVLVERPGDHDRYVVATWWPGLGTTWEWGHYAATRAQADVEFAEAVDRNGRR